MSCLWHQQAWASFETCHESHLARDRGTTEISCAPARIGGNALPLSTSCSPPRTIGVHRPGQRDCAVAAPCMNRFGTGPVRQVPVKSDVQYMSILALWGQCCYRYV